MSHPTSFLYRSLDINVPLFILKIMFIYSYDDIHKNYIKIAKVHDDLVEPLRNGICFDKLYCFKRGVPVEVTSGEMCLRAHFPPPTS